MTDQGPCATRPEEIAEHRRKCWASDCDRTARLEWCGWRYCIPHFWTYVLVGQSTWGHLWVKLRWTEIAWHGYRYDRSERRTVKCLAIIFLPLVGAALAAWWLA